MVLGLVAFVVLLLYVLRRDEDVGGSRYRRARREADVDHEVLEEAEREVRDLGHDADPEEGFHGDEWGPGAPKP